MAGSNMWFNYVADSGVVYGVKVDESNAKAAGFDPYTGGAAGTFTQLPRGTTMRFVYCQAGPIKRKIFVPSLNSPLWTGTQDTILLPDFQSTPTGVISSPAGITFTVGNAIGEKVKKPVSGDSGLTDGTPTG